VTYLSFAHVLIVYHLLIFLFGRVQINDLSRGWASPDRPAASEASLVAPIERL
jgi:hypothetical protein